MIKLLCAIFCSGFLTFVRADIIYYDFTGEVTDVYAAAPSYWPDDIVGSPVLYTFAVITDMQGYDWHRLPAPGSFYVDFIFNEWFCGYSKNPVDINEILSGWLVHYGTSTQLTGGDWFHWLTLNADDNGSSWVLGREAEVFQAKTEGALSMSSHVTLTSIRPVPEPGIITLITLGCMPLALLLFLDRRRRKMLKH